MMADGIRLGQKVISPENFVEELAKAEAFNGPLQDGIEANERSQNVAFEMANWLIGRFGANVALLPVPDSRPTTDEELKAYRGEPEGNSPFSKFDKKYRKVKTGDHEGKETLASWYGELFDDLPPGQRIQEKLAEIRTAGKKKSEQEKRQEAKLNSRRSYGIKKLKTSVLISQQTVAINRNGDVRPNFPLSKSIKPWT
jgi:hypothetical protein